MGIEDLLILLGWITAISYSMAVSNYFVKYINKKYISKLGEAHKEIIKRYRRIMKFIVKNHKWIGTIAILSLMVHVALAMRFNRIMLTGIISASLITAVFLLGLYGSYINKGHRGIWLKIHRILAFLLIIAVVIHIMDAS